MTIGYLINQYPKASHTFIRTEIRALERRGIPVRRYAIRANRRGLVDPEDLAEHDRTRAVLGAGVTTLVAAMLFHVRDEPRRCWRALLRAVRLGRRSDRGLLVHFAYLAEAAVVAQWCREDGVRHIHAHFGTNSAAVALLASTLSAIPYSFTVHGPEEFDAPIALSLKEKIAASRFVAGVSSFGASQLRRWSAPRDWDRIKVIRCGIDGAFARESTAITAERRLVTIARFSEQKGHMVLIEALALLRTAGVDFHATLVGDGPLRPMVEAAIERHDLKRAVTLTGLATGEEVRRALQAARIFVLPSFAEGLPVVIMEAMALGLPVVATHVAGVPELVVDGVTGWLVPAGDEAELAEAIRRALDTPDAKLAEMGRAGRERVAQRHDADREAARLAGLFAAP